MPAVKLKDMLVASVAAPGITVVATAVALVMLTVGVPVTVMRLADVCVFQTVPPAAVQVMFPVPKAIARALALLDANDAQVRV